MKVIGLLDNFLQGQIKKKSGDWDDVANIPDIADTITENPQSPYDGDFWQDKFLIIQPEKEIKNRENKLNIII